MARPERNTVDYFPHKIGDGKKIFSIETKYGNDGYATWFKILEKLATTENHFLDLNDEVEVMYLSAKCRVSEDLLFAIVTDLTRLGCFDKILWERRFIWSDVFIESIQDAYSRRNNNCINYEGLCNHLLTKCTTVIQQSGNLFDSNTQSKVKYSKVKENTVGLDTPTTPVSGKSFEDKCDYFINLFNTTKLVNGRPAKYQITTKVKAALKGRLTKYNSKQIKQAILAALEDRTHIEKNWVYLTPEYILREDILDRYLNVPEGGIPQEQNTFGKKLAQANADDFK